MFTGIIEAVASVSQLNSSEKGLRLALETTLDLSNSKIGDSIAIDGCCLTAVSIEAHGFEVEVSHESLARTTLGTLDVGSIVNLERAMRMGDRLDGHMVQGHVDGTGMLLSRQKNGDAWDISFSLPDALQSQVVEKGSIAVDGISLTVNGVGNGTFHVTIIPHTAQVTTLGDKQTGTAVNLETDIIGKYITNILEKRGIK